MSVRTVRVRGTRRGFRDIGSALEDAARSRKETVILIDPGTYDERLLVRGDVSLVAREPGSVTIRSAGGRLLDCDGTVSLSGIRFVAESGEGVVCRGGSLEARSIEVETHGDVSLWAAPGTRVDASDSTFSGGRVLFAGASGTVQSCELRGFPDNAIAVVEGGRVDVRDCRVERPRYSAVRVEAGSSVTVTSGRFASSPGTMVAVTGSGARADVSGTVIEDAGTAIDFGEGASGSVRDVTIRRARHGFSSRSGANPVVSDCAFLGCVETGINISERGAGTFSGCVIEDAGAIGVFVKGDGAEVGQWGTVDISDCTIESCSVGVAVEGAEGRFRDCRLSRLRFAGVRLLADSATTFDDLSVIDTPVGVDARGTSVGTFVRARLGGCGNLAVSAADQARIMMSDSVVADSGAGAGIQGSASLVMKGSELHDLEWFGMIAMRTGTLVLEGSEIRGPGDIGIMGINDAFVDVRDTRVIDAKAVGFRLLDNTSGQISRCSVTAATGLAVAKNDYVRVVGLTSSLQTITDNAASAEDKAVAGATTIITGPVVIGGFSGQMAWGNEHVEQVQIRPGGDR